LSKQKKNKKQKTKNKNKKTKQKNNVTKRATDNEKQTKETGTMVYPGTCITTTAVPT